MGEGESRCFRFVGVRGLGWMPCGVNRVLVGMTGCCPVMYKMGIEAWVVRVWR